MIDSPVEIARLAALTPVGQRQQVLLRVAPGVSAGGHVAVRTGGDDQKFGLSIADGSALTAVARILDQPRLHLVGGHAVAHVNTDPHLDIRALAARVLAELANGCAANRIPPPRLTIEPGRAIAGPAAVVLYRVLAVKRTRGRTFVAVDGGMSDNPRPALYGARYAPRLVSRRSHARLATVDVVGRRCEAGDVRAAAG